MPEVELFAGDVSLGKKTAEDHFFYFEVPNKGETKLVAVAGDCKDESLIRKVETMNQDYILREQGAVLNWFDITEVEGRFSLNDKVCEIMKTFRGKLLFLSMLLAFAKKIKKANQSTATKKTSKKKKKSTMPTINGGFTKLVGGFTILRLTSMVGMFKVSFTKEELLKYNKQLNRIKKPINKEGK